MITPKRAAIVAVFLLTIIYLFTSSSPSDPPKTHKIKEKGHKIKNLAESESSASSTPKTTSVSDSPAPAEAPLQRPYPPPKVASSRKKEAQRPLAEVFVKNVRDQLDYQFEYDRQSKFPAYIWQTWKNLPSSSDFPEDFRAKEASWTDLHPGFVHEVLNDQNARSLIKLLYSSVPDVLEAYDALPKAVMKADLFRYLILLARGGIYSDIDTTALKSATDWLPSDIPRASVGLIIGIEADPDREDWQKWFSRRIQFCQWTIQAKPGHPVLRDVVATIVEQTLELKKTGGLKDAEKLQKGIIEFTGPAVWTDAIFKYLNNKKYFNLQEGSNITWEAFTGLEAAKKVGDIVVLPITSFSPGVQQMGAKEPDDPMAFVHHEFEGVCRK